MGAGDAESNNPDKRPLSKGSQMVSSEQKRQKPQRGAAMGNGEDDDDGKLSINELLHDRPEKSYPCTDNFLATGNGDGDDDNDDGAGRQPENNSADKNKATKLDPRDFSLHLLVDGVVTLIAGVNGELVEPLTAKINALYARGMAQVSAIRSLILQNNSD